MSAHFQHITSACQVDDKKDEDVVAVLLDEPAPDGKCNVKTHTDKAEINVEAA